MKGTQRGRDLRVGKSGEHAALLARQHFWCPQQLDQDDFEQPGKYRLLAWPHSRCLGVDHGQDAGQPPAVAGTARRNMHNRWQECREKFFVDGVKFEVPTDDANLVRIIVAALWFRRCGGRREILEGDDRRIASSAAQDPGGGSVNSTQSPGSRLCSAVPGSWKRQHPLTTRPKITPLSAGNLQAQSPCPTMCFHSRARGRSNSTSWVNGSTGTTPIGTICNLFGTSEYRSSGRSRIRWVLLANER